MKLVRAFKENAVHQSHQSLVKETGMFADELGFTLDLSAVTTRMEQTFPEIRSRGTSQRLQWSNGKLKSRKRDGKESSSQPEGRRTSWTSCFSWLKNWDTAHTHTIAEMLELYEELTATKIYHAHKSQTNHPNDTLCRLWKKAAESVPHVLAKSSSRVIMRPSNCCSWKC